MSGACGNVELRGGVDKRRRHCRRDPGQIVAQGRDVGSADSDDPTARSCSTDGRFVCAREAAALMNWSLALRRNVLGEAVRSALLSSGFGSKFRDDSGPAAETEDHRLRRGVSGECAVSAQADCGLDRQGRACFPAVASQQREAAEAAEASVRNRGGCGPVCECGYGVPSLTYKKSLTRKPPGPVAQRPSLRYWRAAFRVGGSGSRTSASWKIRPISPVAAGGFTRDALRERSRLSRLRTSRSDKL